MTTETTETTPHQITISPENEGKLATWLRTRGGIAVWSNKDLGSPSLGLQTFTPALTEDGKPYPCPDWRFGTSGPDFIVTDPAQVSVQSLREVKRVKVRRGPPYNGGIHRMDRAKLDAAMDLAGPEASWVEDYSNMRDGSPWFEAVISIPDIVRPLDASAAD